ncbi:MAG: ABC transporter ATP-binding protein/permease [Longimicrobiales bacterium]|nr:ABC transporter ATP-binding protein/permease [Longimicrobiales bacterium]
MRSLRSFLVFLGPYRIQAGVSLFLLIAMVAADLLIPRLTQRIIDHGILAEDLRVVITTSLVMLGASAVSAALALANNYLSVRVAMSVGADVRSALIRKVQTFSFGNLDRLQTGKLIVRSTSDVNMVQMIVMMSLRILTRAPIWVIGATVLLVLTSHRLALMMAGFVPVIVLLVWLFSRRVQPLFLGVQDRLDRLNTVLQENLAGVRVVKAFVRARHEEERFDEANEALMLRTIEVSELLAVFFPAMLMVLNLAVVGAVWIGGRTTIEGGMTVGEVVAAINYLSFALFPILMLAGMMGPVAAADASAGRILEVLDAPPEVLSRDGARRPQAPRGRIAFENVTFGYDGNGAEPVLAGVSFVAEPGETVALVGATGSGKSTLIHLIPRFYDVTGGRITFDGIDIRELDLHALRAQVGIALQEAVLFGGTVGENIRFGRGDAPEEEVFSAARAAQAHEFIQELPQGYDTVIGQRGVNLSGGQRQRIAIARALLVKPKVLILDDSTSAVDVETEVRLQDALDELLARSQDTTTRFVVAQRISTVLLADRILVLDQGRIVAEGSHRELLESSPMYQDIYNSQLGGLGAGGVTVGEEGRRG